MLIGIALLYTAFDQIIIEQMKQQKTLAASSGPGNHLDQAIFLFIY